MRCKGMKIHQDDNVAVAIGKICTGESILIEGKELTASSDIPPGHKIAFVHISGGENVIKYGFPIGRASTEINEGDLVHSGNLATGLDGKVEYEYAPKLAKYAPLQKGSFQGYLRADGEAGIRNEIWIINTVGCVNKTAERIAVLANTRYAGKTDGIYSFSHPFGCSQLGDDLLNTQKILAGLVRHPNAAGVLVLGLGCENNNIGLFKNVLGDYNKDRIRFLNAQGVEDEIEEGVKLVGELVEYACRFNREDIALSKLRIGVKCGGSDAFSGITANPLVGMCSNMLAAYGGTVLMTEVPEMFGAETILMERCVDPEVFDETVRMINLFKNYYTRYGQVIYDNPSPGNKEGGITTLEEKSLGCIQKGGIVTVTDVLNYGEKADTPGLNLLYGPGNDLVACTALVASGAHLILFTTGRGTPLGATVPTVKISCTNGLFKRKGSWMDFDGGRLLEGENMDTVSEELFNYVIQVAGGSIHTKNELNGYREIGILKDGVYL